MEMDMDPDSISEKMEIQDTKISDIQVMVMSLHSRLDAGEVEAAAREAAAARAEAEAAAAKAAAAKTEAEAAAARAEAAAKRAREATRETA